jgi:hypothetical protein
MDDGAVHLPPPRFAVVDAAGVAIAEDSSSGKI